MRRLKDGQCAERRTTGVNNIDSIAKKWIAGLTVYEPGRPIEEVARTLGFKDPDDIIKLASNENALGPSPLAIKAMRDIAPRMHLYPDGDVFTLTRALANKLGILPGQLILGSGSNELIEFVGKVFLDRGTNIIMADRAFVVYKLVADLCQADTIRVPMRKLTHDLDAMLAAITSKTKVVFIANPNNPTGTMVSRKDLDRFMSRVPNHVLVAIDEAYVELLSEDKQPDSLRYVREDRNVIVMRTFSKTYGLAGLRIGYAIAPTNCIKLLHRVRQPFNLNAMAQAAALAALDDDTHVARTRRMVKAGLAYYEKTFKRLGMDYVPSTVNFILVKTGRGRDVFNAMQREGVIVRPMDGYDLPEYIRITVGTRQENEHCIRALKKVLEK
jgi:histidinol-phosphate aminotransferase